MWHGVFWGLVVLTGVSGTGGSTYRRALPVSFHLLALDGYSATPPRRLVCFQSQCVSCIGWRQLKRRDPRCLGPEPVQEGIRQQPVKIRPLQLPIYDLVLTIHPALISSRSTLTCPNLQP